MQQFCQSLLVKWKNAAYCRQTLCSSQFSLWFRNHFLSWFVFRGHRHTLIPNSPSRWIVQRKEEQIESMTLKRQHQSNNPSEPCCLMFGVTNSRIIFEQLALLVQMWDNCLLPIKAQHAYQPPWVGLPFVCFCFSQSWTARFLACPQPGLCRRPGIGSCCHAVPGGDRAVEMALCVRRTNWRKQLMRWQLSWWGTKCTIFTMALQLCSCDGKFVCLMAEKCHCVVTCLAVILKAV